MLWDFAKDALSDFRFPNLTINFFFSLAYCILVITKSEKKLKSVKAKDDQT
tara:strand:+ start:1196 stop:1348 length:153 start_codon:yes stop_codon:yes gene_type:complete